MPDPAATDPSGTPTTGSGETPGTPETPAAPGGTPETATPPAEPLFVANTQDDLDKKFGATRTEGKLALAKQYGFDTIEAFNTAAKAWKTTHDSQLSELDLQKQENTTLKTQNTQLTTEIGATKLRDAATTIAAELGIDTAKLDRVMSYRTQTEGEIDQTGQVNTNLLQHSLATFIAANPEFKADPKTVAATGSTPASAAAELSTIDEQITQAQNKGNIQEAINLQLRKMFQPAV